MSRQDANAAFARTSFLYGGNAAYIEDLYARYEADPKAVDAQWQAFFQSLKDDRADVAQERPGPSWQRPDWPQRARGELVVRARRRLARGREGGRRQGQGAGAGRAASSSPPPRCSRRRATRSTP